MRSVRQKTTKHQRRSASDGQQAIPLDDGTVTTPAALALIRALIPLGLKAVEEALVTEVEMLAGPRYARQTSGPGWCAGARSAGRSISPISNCR